MLNYSICETQFAQVFYVVISILYSIDVNQFLVTTVNNVTAAETASDGKEAMYEGQFT